MPGIHTASRLHFGLLSLPGEGAWSDRHGKPVLPARRFGGVGLMIQSPGITLRARPAREWSVEGPLAERALRHARRFQHSLEDEAPASTSPQHLTVAAAPREHVGLGVGTQLALGVAALLAHAWGRALSVEELALRVERGARSALGVHGFAQGGFLVESGKGPGIALAPLAARVDFPQAWRVVLVLPEQSPGLHGGAEQAAFARLAAPLPATDSLCRLVLLGMLPALVEEDLPAFGEALHDFNARVGEMFAPVQGGTYAGPATAELIAFLRRQGVAGAGQSSWGPGVFAVVEQDRAEHLAGRLRDFVGPAGAEVHVTAACNRGAQLEEH
jgi:beta-RFAP synthase